MSRTIQTVTKWLPLELNEFEFSECIELKKTCSSLLIRIDTLLEIFKIRNRKNHQLNVQNELNIQELDDISCTMDMTVDKFNKIFQKLNVETSSKVFQEKIKLWKELLWVMKLKICYLISQLINEIAYLFIYYGEIFLNLTLKISTSYNNLISMDTKYGIRKTTSICNNTCPYLMFPLRKVSVTRLLQIIASNRAETCCHKLIDCLLETYKFSDNNDDETSSENSSLEIYRALTKHMSPPHIPQTQKNSPQKAQGADGGGDGDGGGGNNSASTETFFSIEELISYEEKNVLELLTGIVTITPEMLGHDGYKKTNNGDKRIKAKARDKVLQYYQEILWGEVGNFLEHVVLWWGSSPLSARPPHSSQHLREWLVQFIPSSEIPQMVLSAMSSLADALGVHVTLTSWDSHFRLALVASKSSKFNPETGKLFCNVLQDLVMLCNQCEMTPDWIVGAPLDELPLVEQIPVLHRLDHSIHTTRLWAINETKKLGNNWNVSSFFMITHHEIVDCLTQLNLLRLQDHSAQIEKKGLGVHVEVCALMRAKLVSEVEVNRNKLKETPNECVKCLARVCRTISLANLQMIFPNNSYWRQTSSVVPEKPSGYVDKYLNQILTPVLKAIDDHIICNMILQIMCEAWLDHIYMNTVKFTQTGACQLLCDFAYIETWVMNCEIIGQEMKKRLLKNEILKRCEGVGRLLLRCPGEQIKMIDKNKQKQTANESPTTSEKAESMPAEMYVPNQEQWLELRAMKKRNLFKASLCCGKY